MNPFYERYVPTFNEAERRIGSAAGLGKSQELRLFTQTLFNRLLFLRFVELKNWLKFDGRHDYLRALFDAGGVRGKSVYRSRILPLFHALSGRSRARRDQIGTAPLLPGGPFDETDLDRRIGDVPDAALELLLGAQGLLYAFPFVLDESCRRDGLLVDPEILGTVFEELVTGRNESGAFYTPRPVVAFMCRGALKDYLARTTSVSAGLIGGFIDDRETLGFRAGAAREIEGALKALKAVDPACGSGAYLVGLLHELVELHELLSRRGLVPRRSRFDLKRRIIADNLFGVDIDPLAVHIARLRLWLSLAVDARTPCALPNLERCVAAGDALSGAFPVPVPDGGFDVVLANPPYVRQELIGRARKLMLQRCYQEAVDGKSDLYCYFFVRGLELLRDGGVQVCISSGSWLDSAFGAKLQQYLLTHGQVVALYDNVVERQFASAAINTVISVVRKQTPDETLPTRFVTFREPLETAAHDSAARRELSVSSEELWNPAGRGDTGVNGSRVYHGGKWSGRYLRAPESYLELMSDASRLMRLDDSELWSIGRGRRTGCDDFFYPTDDEARDWKIESRFLRALVKSPQQFRACPPRTSNLGPEWFAFLCHADKSALRGTQALRYIRHGEQLGIAQRNVTKCDGRWYDLGRQTIPDLILPIAFHERFFVIENDSRVQVHQRFATITVDRRYKTLVPALAALLSSSLVVLLAEVLGRHGLGEGALDFPPDDWREMLIPDIAQIAISDQSQLANCWSVFAARTPLPFSAAAQDRVQQRLDGIVARLIGRDEQFMESIRRDALAMIDARLSKARAKITPATRGRAPIRMELVPPNHSASIRALN